ncbi:hypothetical protein [Pseudescherichia sp.]|uniref:hypothetical protein n=1 Tax=Pseudescherichia sp. TaxID=2055881 RepID=UPI0028AAA245|nr:hypothetical protein [Pseudescherichia sp.]
MSAVFSAIVTFFLNFFLNRKKEEKQVIVETANEASRVSADVSRKTDEELHAQITQVEASIAERTAELDHADGLHAQNRIAADAVDSANDPV